MASRSGSFARALSTATTSVTKPSRGRLAAVTGMRVDASEYTATGGSGLDSTTLSVNLEEASMKSRSAYRQALRDIPDMRRNFSILEDKKQVTAVVKDLFQRHQHVTDPKIVDMLVFKALQELREIREQWKSRHHVYSYIQTYVEKQLRQQAAQKLSEQQHLSKESDQVERKQLQMLSDWRNSGLVPNDVLTWAQFLKWKQDEDDKFANFAVEKKLFSKQQLERSQNAQNSCAMM